MTINFNIPPYNDDLDIADVKKFVRILFRPGFAVQTRELTQSQSLVQRQMEKFARHVFEDGAMVLPGQVSLNLEYHYVKVTLDSSNNTEALRDLNFLDRIVTGATSGIKAKVVNHTGPSVATPNEISFYVSYTKSSTSGEIQTFIPGEVLTAEVTNATATVAATNAVGIASAASVKAGVYFVKGLFVSNDAQTIILDETSVVPTCRIGFNVIESIVVPDEDPTLNDNSQGTSNSQAPGAHRYKIELILTKMTPESLLDFEESENFVELANLVNGELDRIVTITEYSELEKTFARRTKDESGNYTVSPFRIHVHEFFDDGTNGGIYTAADFEYPTQDAARLISIRKFNEESPGSAHVVGSYWRPGSSAGALETLMRSKMAIAIEPGKAYVEGFEILKVGKSYVDIDKSLDFETVNNQIIRTPVGNYVFITNVSGTPDITAFGYVSLRNTPTVTQGTISGTEIGTARVRGIEYVSGTVNTAAALYKLYLFNIETFPGYEFYQVKQIAFTGFTADVSLEQKQLSGTISITTGTDDVTGQGVKWATDPNEMLVVGDYISAGGQLFKLLTAPTNNQSGFTVTANATATLTNANFFYAYAKLYDTFNNTLLYPLPHPVIKTLRPDVGEQETYYTVQREFTATAAVDSGTVSFSLVPGNNGEEFVPFNTTDYVAWYTTEPDGAPVVGDFIVLNSGNTTINGGLNQVTITGLVATGTPSVKLIATVIKTNDSANRKSKTLNSAVTFTTASGNNDLNVVTLGKADVISVASIYMAPDFTTVPTTSHTNVTERYTLDTGQRDNFYDLGRIIKKSDAPIATGRLLITFSYFGHGGSGTYFSVDSYSIPYEDIPTYESPESGWTYNLRDVLDFRPRIADDGLVFSGTGSSVTEIPTKGFVHADYSYYLNRIDKLYLDYRGDFNILKGISALNPPTPENPSSGMVTHKLSVRAGTVGPEDVLVDFVENKRYTMRDIGKLDKRIQNLEFYTELTLEEKRTEDLEIKDADGLDRFKNGIMVDPFRGHGRGDVQNPDYRCSIDMDNREMRPEAVSGFVNLIEKEGANRTVLGYQITGDLITLPYVEETLINQPIASGWINVNPFSVFTFQGTVDLIPPNDEWKDTKQAPDLIVNHEGNFDSISQAVGGMGTIWNEWQTTWTGRPVETAVVTQYREISTTSQAHRDLSGAISVEDPFSGFVSRPGIDQWPYRDNTVTRTTTSTDSTQQRRGLVATVVPKIVTENLGDKVIDVSYIPYIRTRDVVFRGKGLKPNTRVYPFFDGRDVSAHCTAAAVDAVSPVFNPANVTSTGTALLTDARGKVTGVFRIPTVEPLRFRTGERIFKLTSSATNADGATTSANQIYRAQGLIETHQTTILSTRNADVSWNSVFENRFVTNSTQSTLVNVGVWVDPIAQSFMVTKDGGCFITSIDLFFKSKDSNIPVVLEIREMVNGYPGPRVLPFGTVVKDAADVVISDSSTVATKFTFPSPVYLIGATEYCFVIHSDSNNYNVWIAEVGKGIIDALGINTEIPIQGQVYNGSFFASQNASTWSADQTKDMKFIIRKATFETDTTANITFTNDEIPTVELPTNAISTRYAGANLRIHHPNHGFVDGSIVEISGAGNVAGILASRINGEHVVSNSDIDSYVIQPAAVTIANVSSSGTALTGSGTSFLTQIVAGSLVQNAAGTDWRKVASVTNDTNAVLESAFTVALSAETVTILASQSGYVIGNAITVNENRQMDVVYPIVSHLTFPKTELKFYLKATSLGDTDPSKLDTTESNIIPNENFEFVTPKRILSSRNEEADVMETGASKSFFLRAVMNTSNENLSPVIDTSRLSVVTIGNRIDNVSSTSSNINSTVDYTTVVTATDGANLTFTASTSAITTTNATAGLLLSQLQVGKYILVSGGAASSGANNGLARIVSVSPYASGGTPKITVVLDKTLVNEGTGVSFVIKQLDNFVDEKAPQFGTAAAKYVCKRVVLAQPSTSLQIRTAFNKPPETFIDVYYKIDKVDSAIKFDDLPYNLATLDRTPTDSSNPQEFKDYQYTIEDLDDFTTFSVKIVFRSSDTTKIPRAKDFRCIALA